MAQTNAPPRHDSKSPTGVSYRTLTFTYDEEDLSIGGEGHQGLSLRRSYSTSRPPNPGMFDGMGWTDNFATHVSNEPVPSHPDFPAPDPNQQAWMYHLSIGMKSYAFIGGTTGGSVQFPSHVPWGSYSSVSKNGVTAVFNGTTMSGYYTLTESDGTVTTFTPGVSNARVSNIVYPDGTRLDFTYATSGSARLESVFSNRGWAILFDAPTTACVVNLALTHVSATSSCPSGARSASYEYSPAIYYTGGQILTSVTKNSATATYGYSPFDHLSCVRDPGASQCKISNTYGECPPIGWDPSYNDRVRHLKDPVIAQQTATGETYTYSPTTAHCRNTTPNEPDYFPWQGNTVTMTVNGTQTTSIGVNTGGMPVSIVDPLGRSTGIAYEPPATYLETETVDVSAATDPEAGSLSYWRDNRGNIYRTDKKAKPGSGLADITMTAAYPATCSDPKTCNKPTSVTDAKGNVTAFTYASAHGGVLTETGPAVGGVQPVKRYAYAQHYAWLKASGGGYAQAASPVWLLSEERTCRTSATVGNACAGGTSDEVVVSYQYETGSATTPSNLLLKGKAVTADGQTLRTCFGYDGDGNKLWETEPRAGLTTCA
ncbi:hypothetical protein [Sphingomonas koreensis]